MSETARRRIPWGHWKTTLQAILTALVALPGLALTPQFAPYLSAKVTGYIALAGLVAKQVLSLYQKDAGQEDAKLPDGTTKTVDSHETPNDPKATPVDAAK